MNETYADEWRDAINETYDADYQYNLTDFTDEEVARILTKAAESLRNGTPVTFTAGELDVVRHLMPAHEVHQSGAKRWVLENYGDPAV